MLLIKMDLYDRLKRIELFEGLNPGDLDPRLVDKFLQGHKNHGGYSISHWYDSNGVLQELHLTCLADGLINADECPHENPETPSEESFVLLYQR